MSPITNVVMKRQALRAVLAALVVVAACKLESVGPMPDAGPCMPSNTAPTYTELYTKYFAADTPGHCATSGCHLDALNSWACGTDKDTCYTGMVGIGLINPANPLASRIGDPQNSALSWMNINGNMPLDDIAPFPEGRDAILAWVAACAQNN
jgi:hypothetical protein